MLSLEHTRRDFLKSSIGLTGLTLPSLLSLVSKAGTQAPKAKSCIVLYTWGGMSHYESFDPKPEAPSDIRGEFKPISTATLEFSSVNIFHYLRSTLKKWLSFVPSIIGMEDTNRECTFP